MFNILREKFTAWITHEPPPTETPPCDFNRLKHEIRPGDVLLIEGHSRISNIIRSITQSPWTHAALYIGRADDIEDDDLRQLIEQQQAQEGHKRLVIEGLLGKGTVIAPLSSYRHHHIRICRPIGLSMLDTQLVITYAIKAIGQPYSVRHILDLARFLLPWSILPRRLRSSLFHTPSGEPESGICSSLIAEAFTSVKFPILPFIKPIGRTDVELIHRNPYIFTPKDFDYSPYFEIIKYPLMDAKDLPYYRRMPWTEEDIMHQDHGEFVHPKTKKKKKKFLSKWLSNNANPEKDSDAADITKNEKDTDKK